MSHPVSVGTDPTQRELDCLRAYARLGDYGRAAESLGIARGTLSNHLATLRIRLRVESTVEAIYQLRDRLDEAA